MRTKRSENFSLKVKGKARDGLIGGTSFTGGFGVDEFSLVAWFRFMEEIVCDGD